MPRLIGASCILFILCCEMLAAQTGEIRGTVTDAATKEPLAGVNITLRGTNRGAATDQNGEYSLSGLAVGGYSVAFSMLGYEKWIRSDILIKSNKTTWVDAALQSRVIEGDEITVTAASHFTKEKNAPVSLRSLNYEEVRRSPGAREDISRMVQNLPGVVPTTDDRNDLVVRGGSPSEVLFLIDNIEIPNPNHFGTQGATGGPISMINNEFIENVDFMAGGFPAKFGDKLSGVMDISYRNGNPQAFNGKFDLNFAGAGGNFEGPLAGGTGSWMFALHRSFLDFMESMLDVGGIPIYSNFQGKISLKPTPSTRISILGIGGVDRIEIEPEPDFADWAEDETDTTDVEHVINKTTQYLLGATVTRLWSKNLYSSFTASHSFNKYLIDYNRRDHIISRRGSEENLDLVPVPGGDRDVYDNLSLEKTTDLKADLTFVSDDRSEFSLGVRLKMVEYDHKITTRPFDTLNIVGELSSPSVVKTQQSPTPKFGAFAHYTKHLTSQIHLNMGLRYDYFKVLKTQNISPRASLGYRASNRLTFNFASGIFYQAPEFLYITGDPKNRKNLKSLRSTHLIGGFDYLLTESTLFSLEFYQKYYASYPVSNAPGFDFFSTANSGGTYGAVFSGELTSKGSGKASGLELLLQKKLVEGLYGLTSYSFAKIEHQALDGIMRPGEFDNRHVLNIVLGYRLNKSFEFSLKWRYAGGRPYTPFDVPASIAGGRAILDVSKINSERFVPYHRFDLRYDYRKFFKKATLVTYFSIENVYNRDNQGLIFWNTKTQKTEFSKQTGFFPVGGVSVEF